MVEQTAERQLEGKHVGIEPVEGSVDVTPGAQEDRRGG
jgi:hypothetical protein